MIVEIEPVTIKLPQFARTSGVHLSNIIRCIATETGLLKQEILEDLSLTDNYREITDEVALLRISMGLAWEEWYISKIPEIIEGFPEVLDHPGEMHCDGIYMNHDGESLSYIITYLKMLHVVHEVKCTYKSTKTVGRTPEEFLKNFKKNWMWICQLMAYCRAKKTMHGWLHVLFVCGDYKFPIRPMLVIFKITFTQSELDDNWELLIDYRDERLAKR